MISKTRALQRAKYWLTHPIGAILVATWYTATANSVLSGAAIALGVADGEPIPGLTESVKSPDTWWNHLVHDMVDMLLVYHHVVEAVSAAAFSSLPEWSVVPVARYGALFSAVVVFTYYMCVFGHWGAVNLLRAYRTNNKPLRGASDDAR